MKYIISVIMSILLTYPVVAQGNSPTLSKKEKAQFDKYMQEVAKKHNREQIAFQTACLEKFAGSQEKCDYFISHLQEKLFGEKCQDAVACLKVLEKINYYPEGCLVMDSDYRSSLTSRTVKGPGVGKVEDYLNKSDKAWLRGEVIEVKEIVKTTVQVPSWEQGYESQTGTFEQGKVYDFKNPNSKDPYSLSIHERCVDFPSWWAAKKKEIDQQVEKDYNDRKAKDEAIAPRRELLRKYGFPEEIVEEYSSLSKNLLVYTGCVSIKNGDNADALLMVVDPNIEEFALDADANDWRSALFVNLTYGSWARGVALKNGKVTRLSYNYYRKDIEKDGPTSINAFKGRWVLDTTRYLIWKYSDLALNKIKKDILEQGYCLDGDGKNKKPVGEFWAIKKIEPKYDAY